MAETWLLAMRCPGYKWRDSSLGSGMELENLFGGEKGKGTIAGFVRRLPNRQRPVSPGSSPHMRGWWR